MIRRACVLVGILGLFLQGSNGGHMLLVEHSRCAEHGALVHHGDAHPHEVAEYADATSVQGTPDLGSDEAHEHCALSSDRRDASVAIGASLVVANSASTSQVTAQADAFITSQSALFRIAPKNSPPA
jgi:hypothetical protein